MKNKTIVQSRKQAIELLAEQMENEFGVLDGYEKYPTKKDWAATEMAALPKCDFCDDVAAYDAKVKNHSSWAYFCEKHFISHSHQKLGLGLGQKLVLIEGN
tara:strand:- start:204 stop:506 length:303 start_codon:yes stop_codon:yes gene_type:complete